MYILEQVIKIKYPHFLGFLGLFYFHFRNKTGDHSEQDKGFLKPLGENKTKIILKIFVILYLPMSQYFRLYLRENNSLKHIFN